MAFQITDDIMDYRETAETTGKPVGNDLREGLLTYPLLSIVNDGNKDKLLEDIKGLNMVVMSKTLLIMLLLKVALIIH